MTLDTDRVIYFLVRKVRFIVLLVVVQCLAVRSMTKSHSSNMKLRNTLPPEWYPFIDQFPDVTDEQFELMNRLSQNLRDWNEKVNLISRKDIEKVCSHGRLHVYVLTLLFVS
jgi:hypothetical protein